ncbi:MULTISPECIES: hypothetical protein [unclassified Sphingomonas]|uniref:hypothetical protein n=1 Tax=unclassified Sphingomonas TaxID=196159 RepID=UPI0006FBC170|nr:MULTISPECIES: hypothetical protein [unclassified Sphingomonas]KRB88263.1 hypothetical protein ASE22_22795 [Sphingomonas sp. Root720]
MILRDLVLAAVLLLASPAAAEVPLDPGQSATVRLSPQRDLVYPVAPPLTRPPANHGAILGIDIDEPGRYHVALGAPGWIEMTGDGKPVPAAGHSHGEPGSGVAKTVDFDLVPGHYLVMLSGMAEGETSITVGR